MIIACTYRPVTLSLRIRNCDVCQFWLVADVFSLKGNEINRFLSNYVFSKQVEELHVVYFDDPDR